LPFHRGTLYSGKDEKGFDEESENHEEEKATLWSEIPSHCHLRLF
jgi:hypothetical protein